MQDDQVDTASSSAALATVAVEPDVDALTAALPPSMTPPDGLAVSLPPSGAPDPDRALHSDPHDFAGLYIRHRSSFTLHARRYLHDARDADEVVQEAFLRLFLALPELETELQALAYCRRTITNLCIDRYRAQARRPRLVDLDSVPADSLADDDTGDPVVRAEDAAVVRDALSLLSPLHRAALVKREIEEKPLPVIADELEIPEDSVKHVLFRARRALRRLLTATSVAPGADDEAGLGLARASSGGLAALVLLVALGLGSGSHLPAVPVVGDDLPDLPGITDLAKAVGHAVEDVSRAVTSSVGVPEGMGVRAGGRAGQGGGDPPPLSAGDGSASPGLAVPQGGPAAGSPSTDGGAASTATVPSRALLAPVQGDAAQPGAGRDAQDLTGTGARRTDAGTGATPQPPASDDLPRGRSDAAGPGAGPAGNEGLGAPTSGSPSGSGEQAVPLPPGTGSKAGLDRDRAPAEPRVVPPVLGTGEGGSARPVDGGRGGAPGQGVGRAPQAGPAPQGRPARAATPAGRPRPAPPAQAADPDRQAEPASAARPARTAKPAHPAEQDEPASPSPQSSLPVLVPGPTEDTAGVPTTVTGAPDSAAAGP